MLDELGYSEVLVLHALESQLLQTGEQTLGPFMRWVMIHEHAQG